MHPHVCIIIIIIIIIIITVIYESLTVCVEMLISDCIRTYFACVAKGLRTLKCKIL